MHLQDRSDSPYRRDDQSRIVKTRRCDQPGSGSDRQVCRENDEARFLTICHHHQGVGSAGILVRNQQRSLPGTLKSRSSYVVAQPLRRSIPRLSCFCGAQLGHLFVQCHTVRCANSEREIGPLDGPNSSLRIEGKRSSENLPSFGKFGVQLLPRLSRAQKFIALAVISDQPESNKYLAQPSQEHVAGDRSENVVKSLHRVEVADGHKGARLGLIKSPPIRQAS